MDYKEKYEKAIKVARSKIKNDKDHVLYEEDITDIFPELKDSEEGRIRKWLICYFKEVCDNVSEKEKKGVLAWLDKQCEQKPQGKLAIEAIKEEKVDNRNYIKPADKVESEFYEGDWVVYNNDICQIVKREEGCNKLVTIFGIEKELVNERNLSTARLWTIKDAKDGDVLAYPDGSLTIFRYRLCGINAGLYISYVLLTDKIELNQSCAITNVHPATKEHRDTLMKAMTDAGYEWNAEKKELKKIEQKPAWSEEDESMFDLTLFYLDRYVKMKDVSKCETWLKSLRERVQSQPKQEWKPSDEQLEALKNAIHMKSFENPSDNLLFRLYEQLKQL